jgi:hypothetical protein
MRFSSSVFAVASGLLLGALTAPEVFAQAEVDRATARQLGEAGQQALDARDYKTAEDDFRRADKLVHAPTLLLGLARALAGEGKFVDAQETYKRIVREGVAPGSPAVFQRAVEEAAKEVAAVAPKIGGATITVKTAGGEPPPANLQITWDGAPVNAATLGVKRPADPGDHVVHAAADGYKPVDLKVRIPVGGSADAALTIEKDPNAAATATPPNAAGMPAADGSTPAGDGREQPATAGRGPGIWPWVALGVGAAGLITGGVTGAMAMSKQSDLASACSGHTCPPDQKATLDSYNTLGTISTVGFIVGGVGAATGVVLLLLKPNFISAPARASAAGLQVEPVLGLGTVGAAGRF